jgi:hypothetical protein
MTISAIKSNHIADPMYSEVLSWMLDFDGNEVDERTHGFVFNSRLTPEQRATTISDVLGARMWCDIGIEYIDEDDFDSGCYDSTHILEVLLAT